MAQKRVETSDVEELLGSGNQLEGYVPDRESSQSEKIQGSTFLRNCVAPAVGQRVEILFKAKDMPPGIFFMSGEVTEVKPPPLDSIHPMQNCHDKGVGKGSMGVSGALVPRNACSNMSRIELNKPHFGRFCQNCTGIHMSRSEWDQVPQKAKQEMFKMLETWHSPFHGHEVICAARLHFNSDMKRGSDDGPWKDAIPIDGRDVWQLTLVADDEKMNYWTYKPGSLVNLGRDQFPRCWPWAYLDEAPYQRDGVDRFDPGFKAVPYQWPFLSEKYVGPTTPMEDLLRSHSLGKLDASVDRTLSRQMETIQGRGQFLFGRPALASEGQRVEITFKVPGLPSPVFLLSGKVTKVHPAPNPMCGIRPMRNCEDRGKGKGSMDLSGMLVPWIPCKTCGGNDCDGATVNYRKIQWGHFCKKCGGIHGDNWEEAPDKLKKNAFMTMLRRGAAFHGQEVECCARLNYNWDMTRGIEEGPWTDGIPFDGRDIWKLTLVVDDSKSDIWRLKPGSLVKVGRDQFPRCWPWSNDDHLPYARDGVDHFNPEAPIVHPALCLGPFGCPDPDYDLHHAHHRDVHTYNIARAA